MRICSYQPPISHCCVRSAHTHGSVGWKSMPFTRSLRANSCLCRSELTLPLIVYSRGLHSIAAYLDVEFHVGGWPLCAQRRKGPVLSISMGNSWPRCVTPSLAEIPFFAGNLLWSYFRISATDLLSRPNTFRLLPRADQNQLQLLESLYQQQQ